MQLCARWLAGCWERAPRRLQTEEHEPRSAQQAAVWIQTAEYVAARIGVPRDVSANAAAAMRAVLAEVAEAARPFANEIPGHNRKKTD